MSKSIKNNYNNNIVNYNDNMAKDAVGGLLRRGNLPESSNTDNINVEQPIPTLSDTVYAFNEEELDDLDFSVLEQGYKQTKKATFRNKNKPQKNNNFSNKKTTNENPKYLSKDKYFDDLRRDRLSAYDTNLDYKNLPYSNHNKKDSISQSTRKNTVNSFANLVRETTSDFSPDEMEQMLLMGGTPNNSSDNFEERDNLRRELEKYKNISSFSRKTVSILRITGLVLIILLLSSTSLLFLNIKNKNAQINEFEKLELSLADYNKINQELLLKIERLEESVITLTKEKNALNEKFTDNDTKKDVDKDVENTKDESKGLLPLNYTVKPGDSLVNLSKKYYGNPDDYVLIVRYNGLTSTNLKVGQKLVIPVSE